MKVREYTNIQNYIEKKNLLKKEKIINETIPLIDIEEANKTKRPKKDNSVKGDIFFNCRCCGVLIAPDWYSQIDKRYCADCL